MYDAGTSMATPLVSGCAATVRSYLRSVRDIGQPKAALVKAVLINSARAMAGQYTDKPDAGGLLVPNNHQGFGRVDLGAVLGPPDLGDRIIFRDEHEELGVGESVQVPVTIPADATALKVTLVWTDYPSHGGLVNDLDLVVSAGGVEWHGNQHHPWPVGSTAGFDRLNNVEQVLWEGVPAGPAVVEVRAHRVDQERQNFALVIRMIGPEPQDKPPQEAPRRF
jgi:hypothetical protein